MSEEEKRDVMGVLARGRCFEAGTFDIVKCKTCRGYENCKYSTEHPEE